MSGSETRSERKCNQPEQTILSVYFQCFEATIFAWDGMSERESSAQSGPSRRAIQTVNRTARLVGCSYGWMYAAAFDAQRGAKTDQAAAQDRGDTGFGGPLDSSWISTLQRRGFLPFLGSSGTFKPFFQETT